MVRFKFTFKTGFDIGDDLLLQYEFDTEGNLIGVGVAYGEHASILVLEENRVGEDVIFT
jgi:hypothetical protein